MNILSDLCLKDVECPLNELTNEAISHLFLLSRCSSIYLRTTIKITKYFILEMDANPNLREICARKFIDHCKDMFGWGDLSSDVIMDVGCGEEGYGGKAILEKFPDVGAIIGIDSNPKVVHDFRLRTATKIECVFADIEKRTDIHRYEGKVDKVISTHVLHQIQNKEKVFKNVHRLLKPGGEAAFLFISDFGLYHVLDNLRQDPKYKDYFKGSDIFQLYSSELKADNYREMLEKIGFKVIEISEEKDQFSNDQFQIFQKTLYDAVAKAFSVPPELVPEINDSASRVYRTKYCDRNSIYAATEMSIFVTKPSDSDTGCSSS